MPHLISSASRRVHVGLMDGTRSLAVVLAPAVEKNSENGAGLPPNVLLRLEGHNCAVTSLCFHPEDPFLASGGFDGKALLWQVTDVDATAVVSFTGHKSSITALTFLGPRGESLVTASADKTVAVYDFATSARLKVLRGHDSHVTSVDARASLAGIATQRGELGNDNFSVVTGSNDRTARVWDIRSRHHREELTFAHRYQVLDVKLGASWHTVFTSGIEPDVQAWDMRKPSEAIWTLHGHSDMVTGLAVSPIGSHLASHGADGMVGIWDVRPFIGENGDGERLERFLTGCTHGFEHNLMRLGWDRGGTRVVAGSASGFITVWDADDGELVCNLGGHQGCVNDVRFSPVVDSLVASGGSDHFVLLGHMSAASS
jgi:Prp8 binding protein